MTGKERLVTRLIERIAIHSEAAEQYRLTEPVKAAVAQAWADSAEACLGDVRDLIEDDWAAFDAVEALSGGYVR